LAKLGNPAAAAIFLAERSDTPECTKKEIADGVDRQGAAPLARAASLSGAQAGHPASIP